MIIDIAKDNYKDRYVVVAILHFFHLATGSLTIGCLEISQNNERICFIRITSWGSLGLTKKIKYCNMCANAWRSST